MSFAARLFYGAITFGMLLLAFLAYQLIAVPLLEGTVTAQQVLKPRHDHAAVDQPYDELLAKYFQPGSWERERAHVLRNDQFLMLVEKWEPEEAARLRIWPCTILYRAAGLTAEEGTPSGSRLWMLRAPQGATLQLQEGFDVTRGKIGKLVGGFLQGQIEITSPETAPGAGDGIQLRTSNLNINEQQIATSEELEFQWGPHRGSGRGLLLRFMPPNKGEDGPFHANLLELRLAEIEQLQWMLHAGDTFKKPVPVAIRSQGALTIDMRGGMARIDDRVTIDRVAETEQDQLVCDELTVRFSSLSQPAKDVQLERVAAVGNPARFRAQRSGRESMDSRSFEVAAPSMEYQMLAQTFVASGPGQLQIFSGSETSSKSDASQQQPSPELVAEWQRVVRWGPQNGYMQLSIDEGARGWTAAGSIAARQLQAQFELPKSDPQSSRRASPFDGQLVPRQIVATGDVSLASNNIEARTSRLQVAIRRSERLPVVDDTMQLRAPENSRGRLSTPGDSSKRVRISSQSIELAVEQRGNQMQLSDAIVDGRVLCQTYDKDRGQPTGDDLEIMGNRLVLRGFDAVGGVASLSGAPAQVRGKKLVLRGPTVQLDRGANRIWIDGAGTATLPLPPQIAQRYPEEKAFADVRWNHSMEFDGQSIICQRGVDIRGPAQLIRAEQVAVRMSRSIPLADFDLRGSNVAPEIVEAIGGVQIEHRTLGTEGVESMDSARLERLSYRYSTGALTGTGPGWFESVRRGSGRLLPNSGRPNSALGLVYMRVEFQNQLAANVQQRMATFDGGVRGTYGSVSDWNRRLELDTARLTRDQIILRADQLRAMQIQRTASQVPVEVQAVGNTSMESAQYVAQAYELKYEQLKGMFSLMGKGQTPAKIWDKSKPNSPQFAGCTIRFWPQKNAFKAEVQELNFELGNQPTPRR